MVRSEVDYENAKTAAASSDWCHFQGFAMWDTYWHQDESEIELFLKPGGPQLEILDLRDVPASKVSFSMQFRASEQTNTRGGLIDLRTSSGVKQVRVHAGPLESTLDLDLEGVGPDILLSIDGAAESGNRPTVVLHNCMAVQISADSVQLSVNKAGMSIHYLTAVNSTLTVERRITSLHARGTCRLDANPARVDQLRLGHGADFSLGAPRTTGSQLDVGHLVISESTEGSRGRAAISGSCRVDVNSVTQGELRLAPAAVLAVAELTSGMRFSGAGTLIVKNNAFDVEFAESEQGFPLVELDPWAILQDASGTIRLGRSARAQINGTPLDGLTLHSLEGGPDQPLNPTDGLLIRNFHVPVELAGMQTISALTATSAVAIPMITKDLPGARAERRVLQSTRARIDRRVSHMRTGSIEIDSLENIRADYSAALARLADRRNAPGSIRTRLGWMEYRMRQSTATGRTEWLTLAAYRTIGYGERAGPPFALFGVLVVAFSAIGLSTRTPDISLDGVGRALQYFIDWLTAPVHVLRLAERGDIPLGRGRWAFAGRVALAVPFITGVLALRNYVKRSSGD